MEKTKREQALEKDIQLGISMLVAIGVTIKKLQACCSVQDDMNDLIDMRRYVDNGLANLDYHPVEWNNVYTYRD